MERVGQRDIAVVRQVSSRGISLMMLLNKKSNNEGNPDLAILRESAAI